MGILPHWLAAQSSMEKAATIMYACIDTLIATEEAWVNLAGIYVIGCCLMCTALSAYRVRPVEPP